MKRTTRITAAVAIALGIGATTLYAQPYGPGSGMGSGWGPGHMMGYGPGAGRGMGPGWGGGPGCEPGFGRGGGYGADTAGFLEHRLAELKSVLKITAAQEGAWKAYAEAAKLQAEGMRNSMTAMRESRATTVPERIELRNRIGKERLAQAEAAATRLKDLYATLSPEQKATADQVLGAYGPRADFGPGYRFR